MNTYKMTWALTICAESQDEAETIFWSIMAKEKTVEDYSDNVVPCDINFECEEVV
tara:strand:+ start:270 stop:434 length:165 start_codon:yes stop_codon:yes gene_type:complete